MANRSVGVAVIGTGKAGRAHADAYRSANTVFGSDRSDVRLVAIAGHQKSPRAEWIRGRYGYDRTEDDWEAIVEADDIQAVSVAVAPSLQREVIERLLASGKHVLCEKPFGESVEDASAMAASADLVDQIAAVGFSYRRSPAVEAIRQYVLAGRLGTIVHFGGEYLSDYGLDLSAGMNWRYRGDPPSGALSDIGSHLVDLAEYVCGPIESVSGAQIRTHLKERSRLGESPVAATSGGDSSIESIRNEDISVFTARLTEGVVANFSVSRIAHGLPNALRFEIFGTQGHAGFDLHRPSEFTLSDDAQGLGPQQIIIGPSHPYVSDGLPMDIPGAGHGMRDFFTYQARSFIDQIGGFTQLPPCASFRDGLRNTSILHAVVESAQSSGSPVAIGEAVV